MNFKKIVTLSIVTFFVLSSIALAETSTTTTTTQTTSAPVIVQEVTPQAATGTMHVAPAPQPVYRYGGYGYTRDQIRSMPMVARPDRPGHFFGNTVRALYRARRGW
ncbi:MAG: hypothetical protein PVH19_07645 [Planctomycetia bacterium]|jgi:hypothetical protein